MALRALPEGFEKLVNLERESFMKCIKQVQHWPESIVEHPLLRDATELDLSHAKLVALPERFRELKSLTSLRFGTNEYNPMKLESLPEGSPQQHYLSFQISKPVIKS